MGRRISLKELKWGVVIRPPVSQKKHQVEVTEISLFRNNPSSSGQLTPEMLWKDLPALPTHSIKRKPIASIIREPDTSAPSPDLSEKDTHYEHGHCSFSAEDVEEPQPGTQYTGIRLDQIQTTWLLQGRQFGLGLLRFLHWGFSSLGLSSGWRGQEDERAYLNA
jgi:hypothetical protein